MSSDETELEAWLDTAALPKLSQTTKTTLDLFHRFSCESILLFFDVWDTELDELRGAGLILVTRPLPGRVRVTLTGVGRVYLEATR